MTHYYRVWFHPKNGDDYARDFNSAQTAKRAVLKSKIAERAVYHTTSKSLTAGEQTIPLSSIELNKTRKDAGIKRKRKPTSPFGASIKMPSFKF